MENKYNSHQITVAEMAPHVHTFYTGENKVHKIAYWLAEWIKSSLKNGQIKPNDFLPLKGDLAFHIGVSKGTIQNAYRMVEDMGLIESKQRIGTYIKNNKIKEKIEKHTSKREFACSKLKNYIVENKLRIGDSPESIDVLSKKLMISNATIRCAINSLIEEGIIEKRGKGFYILRVDYESSNVETKTLVTKIAERIKQQIIEHQRAGSKVPSNPELAKKYNVSIKTIHDALKILKNEGMICTRRGKYGTIVTSSESETDLYIYEKIKIKIREYIIKNCEVGSKLPSIRNFAKLLNTSTKTIKTALDELEADGYVTFVRGRQGGTFVTEVPQNSNEAYTWLAISSDYIQE